MATKRLWIMYDDSPARLPLYVCDSATELVWKSGNKLSFIRSSACKIRKGVQRNGKFATVDIEEDEYDG